MTRVDHPAGLAERPIPPVKGTADRRPSDLARLSGLEALVLERFALAGYERLDTPILEPVDLHERKSGAGIVSKLFELAGDGTARVCLRPELTAGIVRAYTAIDPMPVLPWRVGHSGPAFRREASNRPDRLREFHQVGVERLGDSGPLADAEVIALAASTLAEAGVRGATIRLGHVGLTLEMLGRSGLPATAQSALVEMLSEAAADGGDVNSLGRGLGHFEDWLRQNSGAGADGSDEEPPSIDEGDDGGIDRLFRTLVPVVSGRRSGREIIGRLRRKWDQGHAWLSALGSVRDRVRELADLKGPLGPILDRLGLDFEALAPDSVASLRDLARALGDFGVDLDRVELDLGFGRGIGFYSRMIFEIVAPTPEGPVEVCGGGRYDGLARVLGSDRDDRGVGFAFGLERVDSVLTAQGNHPGPRALPTFLVVPDRPELWKAAVGLASTIRSKGSRAILEAGWTGAELADRARSLGAGRSLVLGDPQHADPLVLVDHARGVSRPVDAEDVGRIAADLARESARESKP